ncbi:MAG: glycosyltransferase family 4 protein [Gammaproteobacteria bacterium]|nr:glycosyltransferase family 4 protein [Gammaproteobacteria bacterium]
MKASKHIVVIDAIAFAGGSKVATNTFLATLAQPGIKITIITKDKSCWDRQYQFLDLYEMPWLSAKEQGLWYFLRHFILALNILMARLRYGPINIAVGASGPGVDLSLYLSQLLLKFEIMQLIHGPVACSNTIARCLTRASHVFYLKSTLPSIKQCLIKQLDPQQILFLLSSNTYQELHNGLLDSAWPTQCQYHTPRILWAASLLKWKGLDFFVQAIAAIPRQYRPITEICYIRPLATTQAICQAPIKVPKLYWHEQPEQLDAIRASCNIFISTSTNEPFGLSILEALAAGHCVIIPMDNAHWDQTLTHGLNCLKYQAHDVKDLVNIVLSLSGDINKVKQLGSNGQQISKQYQADKLYQKLTRLVLKKVVEQ